ncbi:ornithine aminotransferase [Deltaproteobacteria bacterium]|nr:ornithine aminotransferase [Deltaproteobacteria bacterium]
MGTVQRKSDVQIRDQVLAELEWDTRLLPAEVGVEVRNAVVTLTGVVDSWAKKVAARDAAHRVVGVHDVANDIVIHVPGGGAPTDTEIAARVRRTLEWDVFVPHARIQSTVSDGIVTLEGELDYWSQASAAERAVRNLAGVKGVANLITVGATAITSDVRRAIGEALARHAAREARDVVVEAAGSSVTIRGHVDSWAERKAVVGAVLGTRGVSRVEDQLSIW